MFIESMTALMIASLAMGQAPVPATQITQPVTESSPAQSVPAPSQVGPAPAGQNASPLTAQTIVVPAGTAIQLTLLSAVKTKSKKVGDKVRAVVAFPVTIGTQLAIPAGTFVDGTVSAVMAHPKGGQPPLFRVHFTGLVYSNGYSVALSGENTQALFLPYQSSAPSNEVVELTPIRLPGARFSMGEGQTSTPVPPPFNPGGGGGNPAIIGGIVAGAAGAFVIGTLIWAHHHTNKETDVVLFDAGWQFQMVLDRPVTLDAAQVAAAGQLN
jgi:hypothetical protein